MSSCTRVIIVLVKMAVQNKEPSDLDADYSEPEFPVTAKIWLFLYYWVNLQVFTEISTFWDLHFQF